LDIKRIRRLLRAGRYSVTNHALEETFAEGLEIRDILRVLRAGEVIEEYPERRRCLIFGWTRDGVPIHVVCDLKAARHLAIWTAYVPDEAEWIDYQYRR